MTVDKPLRTALRDSACARFATVLGPGADRNHEGHIHLDLIARTHAHKICEWDVRELPPPAEVATVRIPLPVPRPVMLDAIVNHSDKL